MAVNALSLQRSMARSRGGKHYCSPQPSPSPSPLPPPAAGVAQYVATLNTGSALYIFDSANAVDQGNYVGTFVQQKSLRVTLSGCPFTVYFRPDVNGLRDEVVVELGKMWSGTPAHVTAPYTITVTKNSVQLFQQTVPNHWWWARWRWQSAPRPFVRTVASLIASGHFLPYSKSYLYGYTSGSQNWSYSASYTYAPMGIAGMDWHQGDGGDRPEIGPLTLAQSDYIMFGTTAAKDVMLAQAEASGTHGFHIRDENTGAWLNNRVHQYYSLNPASALPHIPNPTASTAANYITLAATHMSSLCYAPYMFTDDPYYLEEMQACALYHIVEATYITIAESLPGLVNVTQGRGSAWGVRDVAHCAKATPAIVPSWLLPQSVHLANLADNRTFLQRYQNSPSIAHTIFRVYTELGYQRNFFKDYVLCTFAWVVRMGFSEWADGHAWICGAVVPHVTNDMTGWPKGWPVPYHYTVLITGTDAGWRYDDTTHDANVYPSWNAAFQRYVSDQAASGRSLSVGYPPTWDGVRIMEDYPGVGFSYFVWRQAGMNLAAGLGVTGAAGACTWLDAQIPILKAARFPRSTNDPRFSFAKT
jgi:hypothetical protein